LAQSAADKCIFQHNYDGPYAGLGENVYKGARRNLSEIFMFMFLERENFNFKTSSCNINSGSKYSMFTNLRPLPAAGVGQCNAHGLRAEAVPRR
ncbi:hypothetical protein BOX15_Mlig007126g2, partial [Macrostomum lignano]